MAIGLLSVLKLVPWGQVIENAPKVANSAKKLWNNVGKTPVGPDGPAAPVFDTPGDAPEPVAALQAEVVQLQNAVSQLQQQMLESTALIGSLAEQNTQLIARVEVNRKRFWALVVVLLVVIVVVVSKLI